jgi:hypothetical protein
MNRVGIAVLVLFVVGLSTACNKPKDEVLPDGTKLFGERRLKDGTKTTVRIEYPSGVKHFDTSQLPDGTQKIGRVEDPNGQEEFDLTILPDQTQKIVRIEYPDGKKKFDVTLLPDGTMKEVAREEYPSGEKHFDVTIFPDHTTKIGRVEFSNGAKILDTTLLPDNTLPVHFKTDPENALPVYSVEQLDQLFDSRKGGASLIGKQIRIRGQIKLLGTGNVEFFHSPKAFMSDWFDVDGFADTDLDPLEKGNVVELVCEYTGTGYRNDRPGDNFASMTYTFSGREIHRVFYFYR